MLAGWLREGLDPSAVSVIDPCPSDWLRGTGVQINVDLPNAPAIAMIAVKPQMIGDALPQITALGGGGTLFLSVAAGTLIQSFEDILGGDTPIIRAMPNTPAAISQGITAIIGNVKVTAADLDIAESLLRAIGDVVRLDKEDQMDAVTGVSGSGPAYVFHLIETLTQAGIEQGLDADLAGKLAKATVAGAAALAQQADESPAQLRVNVTSPNGTTAAALDVLMDDDRGFTPLLSKAVAAATNRSKELANG